MPLISLTEARAIIQQHVVSAEAVSMSYENAARRVLREDVLAPEDLPAFDRSAMDGYALGASDDSERFRVVAEIQAGQVSQTVIRRGECARIFTGAALPEGAGQVIMQEETERDGEWMIPRKRDSRAWIRKRGEDARRGDRLLSSGIRLRAGELSLLAQLGHVGPRVSPAVRVLHFTTGDELVDPANAPALGQIRDSNSILVASLLGEAGAQLVGQKRCGDTLGALTGAVNSCDAESWDVLLVSGGASVGDFDFGARALEALGFQIHFRQMNLRPGKPLVFATRRRQSAFVIPGNPVSHFVTFHLAIRLALECHEGAAASWPLTRVRMGRNLDAKPDARDTWWPAHVTLQDGEWRAFPLAWQSSGDIRGLVSANSLLPLPSGTGPLAEGADYKALLVSAPW